MPAKPRLAPPNGAALTTVTHAVAFYETDAMGVVHHSNYVRYLEHARVAFLAEHDQAYVRYVEQGYHVPVTHVQVYYHRPSRFGDRLSIECWLAWYKHASFGFAYRIRREEDLIASGVSDHALIREDGQPVRMPEAMRERMGTWLAPVVPS